MKQTAINSSINQTRMNNSIQKGSADAVPVVTWPIETINTVAIVKNPSWTVRFGLAKKNKTRIRALAYKHQRIESSPFQGVSTTFLWEYSALKKNYVWYPYSYKAGNIGFNSITGAPSLPVLSTAEFDKILLEADKKAKLKLLLKAKDSKVNLIQAYAESHQTHKLIGDVAIKLGKVILSLRAGKLKEAADILGVTVSRRKETRFRQTHRAANSRQRIESLLAQGVLSVQYGIRPLIADVIGAAELYAQKVVEEVVGEVRAKSELGSTVQFTATDSARRMVQTSVSQIHVTVKYGATFVKGSEIHHTLSQMGITNPLLIAWELMPWSFVIDWFLPIGNYISSLDATYGLDFVDGYKSVKTSVHRKEIQSWNDPKNTSAGAYGTGLGSNRYVKETFERTVLTAWPVASLPSFKNPLSLEHALNACALLVGIKKNIYR